MAAAAGGAGWMAGLIQQAWTRAFEGFGRLRIDVALPHHATERRLDVAARAAEAVIEIEMAESGVEIVPPEQVHDPAAEPDAFRDCRPDR